MQFELSGIPDIAMLSTALRPLDPEAKVALDGLSGRLDVMTSASRDDVVAALARVGYAARPLEQELHVSGGSTCCGGCG